MTCVGFCLNVLKGFLDDDYLEYSDWDQSTHDDLDYLDWYCVKYNIDKSKVRASHRRIAPYRIDYLWLFQDLPIRKIQILDNKRPEVADTIKMKEQSKSN